MTSGEAICAVVQSETSIWTILLTLIPSLIAIALATYGNWRDNRIRRTEKAQRAEELATAEERRALRDAQKVVWTYKNLDDETSCITVINAGSGPILQLGLFAARMPNGDGVGWLSTDEAGSSTPVILPGQSHDFEGKWVRHQGTANTPIATAERPKEGVLCELHWIDDSGHVWDTDNEFAQVHLSAVIGPEDRSV